MKSLESLLNEAESFLRNDDWVNAEQRLTEAIQLEPENIKVLMRRSQLRSHYPHFLDEDYDSERLVLALDDLQTIQRLTTDREELISVYLLRAFLDQALGHSDDLHADLTWLIENRISPDDYLFRARINFKRDRYSDAISDITMAISLFPLSVDPLWLRARMWFKMRKYDFVVYDITTIIALQEQLKPEYIELHTLYNLRAQAFILLGERDKAFFDADEARHLQNQSGFQSMQEFLDAFSTLIDE